MLFLDRFSPEVESWRDQPVWAYTLHHFGMEPLEMRHDTLHSYIVEGLDLKGNHHYTESTVSYAKQKNAKTTTWNQKGTSSSTIVLATNYRRGAKT